MSTPPAADEKPTDLGAWAARAADVKSTTNPLKVPYEVAMKEALALVDFVAARWEPDAGRPGLSRVKKRFPKSAGVVLLSLVRAVETAQSRLLRLADPLVIEHGERARELVDQLESVIEFVIAEQGPVAAQATREKSPGPAAREAEAFHSQDGQRCRVMIDQLRDYARIANEILPDLLDADSGFDDSLVEQAQEQADELEKALKPAPGAAADIEAATVLRNRLITLMQQQVGVIRRTARHVFNEHPEILREAVSVYQPRRRAIARRKALRAK